MRAVMHAFEGKTVRRRPTWRYRFALLFATFGLGLLVVAYFLCIVGIGFGLYLYAVRVVPFTKHMPGRGAIVVFLMHAGIGFAGLALLYSLVAPLFRWGRAQPEGQLLEATAYPVLHSFVKSLCTLINSPVPDEIRTTPYPNASAGRYGRFLGIIGGRFVLEIGTPLFYGFDLRSLTGVIAHELGHFSQATSGFLHGNIVRVTNWFQEAAVRTEGVQDSIGENSDDWGGYGQVFVFATFIVTLFGWLLLLLFALLSRMLTFYLMRQTEFDADRYQAEVVGSAHFAHTFERLMQLDVAFERVVKATMSGAIAPESAASLAQHAVQELEHFSEYDLRRAARRMAPKRAQWFDSHPTPTERIAAVARHPQPGIFQLEGPALCLLTSPDRAVRKRRRSEFH